MHFSHWFRQWGNRNDSYEKDFVKLCLISTKDFISISPQFGLVHWMFFEEKWQKHDFVISWVKWVNQFIPPSHSSTTTLLLAYKRSSGDKKGKAQSHLTVLWFCTVPTSDFVSISPHMFRISTVLQRTKHRFTVQWAYMTVRNRMNDVQSNLGPPNTNVRRTYNVFVSLGVMFPSSSYVEKM